MNKAKPQKPHLLKVLPPMKNSLVVKGDEISWSNPWHFHPEIELLYCIKGKGTNYIGNCIQSIEEGEVLLLGKNLPHTRQRDKDFYNQHPNEIPQTVVIQFKEDFLGDKFFSIGEFEHIGALLEKSKSGIKIVGSTLKSIQQKLSIFSSLSGAASVLSLLSILDEVASSGEYVLLNPLHFLNDGLDADSSKINKVYQYTAAHFKEPISLEDVASITNYSVSAFCRFFKKHTRKSYFQYLTEIRIAHACQLLMAGDMDISEICFASGFNNFSNFHKQFKKNVKLTPSEYKQKGLKKVPGIAA